MCLGEAPAPPLEMKIRQMGLHVQRVKYYMYWAASQTTTSGESNPGNGVQYMRQNCLGQPVEPILHNTGPSYWFKEEKCVFSILYVHCRENETTRIAPWITIALKKHPVQQRQPVGLQDMVYPGTESKIQILQFLGTLLQMQ